MWAIPALTLLALVPSGDARVAALQGPLVEPLILHMAASDDTSGAASGKEPAASAEPARLAVATPTARRGAPRVSKVRCAPMVCQSNCPVVKTAGGDPAPDKASAPLARAATPPAACAHAAAKDEGADTSL